MSIRMLNKGGVFISVAASSMVCTDVVVEYQIVDIRDVHYPLASLVVGVCFHIVDRASHTR
jgi:hypothetical protein